MAFRSLQVNAEQCSAGSDVVAREGRVVHRTECAGAVEVVVEGGAHVVEHRARTTRRQRRAPGRQSRLGQREQLVAPLPIGSVVLVEQGQANGGRLGALGASSSTKTRLPSDLDILVSSSPTSPTCIQCLTNGAPVTDSLWAASHSW